MDDRFTRRHFLKVMAALGGAVLFTLGKLMRDSLLKGGAQAGDYPQFLPFMKKDEGQVPTATSYPGPDATASSTPTETSTPQSTATATNPGPTRTPGPGPKVIHVHALDATSWNGNPANYWEHVNQGVVDDMVDQGVMALTGKSSISDAWSTILPNYQAGQGIAIKVNFNNTNRCDDTDSEIDAIIHPINAIVRGLKGIGVVESDIWVYDAVRTIPTRFRDGSIYSGIQYFNRTAGRCGSLAGFDSSDPSAYVNFNPPPGTPLPPQTKITDLLIRATYLINMPIMKRHNGAGVTLSFKNHLGTVDNARNFHHYIKDNGDYYSPEYNPLVDLYLNRNIVDKTILTIGDAIFASHLNTEPPSSWATFGNDVPNSLFFAWDPVAVDCVMCDFLNAEKQIYSLSDDYLRLAESAGLGVYERGDPWGSGYSQINYQLIEL